MARRLDNNADGDFTDAGDATYFHITDVQFSSVAMIDDTGDLVERVVYDAYGNARHSWTEDMDGDGDVDSADQTIFNASYNGPFSPYTIGHANYNVDADFDRDGDVDLGDNVRFNNANPTSALAAGQISDPAGPDNIIGYDGYVLNGVQNLYTVRFRTYQPGTGRWVERDPIQSFSGSLNYYEYVRSTPYAYDPFGLVPPAPKGAHPIPLGIGGGVQQLCFPLDDFDHTAQHQCLADELTGGNKSYKKLREEFAKMSDADRRATIRKGLIAGGVNPQVITDEVLDAIFVGCEPGKNNSRKRQRPKNLMDPQTGKMVKGTIASTFLVVLGIADQAQAAASQFDRGGSKACSDMLRRIKKAFRGNGGGACGVDCNELAKGEQDAEQCALDLAVALNDAGAFDTVSGKTLRAPTNNYTELVVNCKDRCKNAKAAGNPGSSK